MKLAEPMAMPDQPESVSLTEELTAYLDGELDADSVRRVEERLARDAAYRAELQQLERAWDLLDRLPRATVQDSFNRTTMEMIAVAAAEDAAVVEQARPSLRRRQKWLGTAGVLAAGAAGFVMGHALWPDHNQQLLRDLPVLQNFERFYQADDIEFLKLLDRAGLFAEEEPERAS